ncbi:class I SAM-dependent methyltransferase [Rubinisphaera sp. JC750]|uniref:class I SAM-dependent methyltransferase n=1 Tax=Rubinisphaera sp. JC750 TaxID=2898658 RepID=UPI001F39B150|nr:class I SAM-dependent methyltransferase [Rubinisphaera sp. JC750]
MVSLKRRFRDAYRKSPPWDVGTVQPAFVEVASQIRGDLLDAGCGTGENAIHFAQQGCDVTGLDFIEVALEQAKAKSVQRHVPNVNWEYGNALELTSSEWRFDSIIDCGLYHSFDPEPRDTYVAGLRQVARDGGLLVLLCFSDREPVGQGPNRISEETLQKDFANGWEIEAIDPVRFAVREDLPEGYFSPGGPHAWRLLARRIREPEA